MLYDRPRGGRKNGPEGGEKKIAEKSMRIKFTLSFFVGQRGDKKERPHKRTRSISGR